MEERNYKIAIWLLAFAAISSPLISAVGGQQTIGWQYDTFAENLEMTITPDVPTTDGPINIEVVSTFPDVYVQVANLYATITPNNGLEFQFQTIFQRWNNTAMTVSLGPFPYNGYSISLWVIAYDWLNTPMDSRDSFNIIHYDVGGSGWKYNNFENNVNMEYAPMAVNATEEVDVRIWTNENVSFGGANLWWTYETLEGELIEGVGKNFTSSNIEGTEMEQFIPGYPPGTNVTFWIVAWDQYNEVIVSDEYNYSVLGVVQYTDFPFVYTDNDDRSEWVPDFWIYVPLAASCALGVPLFLYLYVLGKEREGRRETLVEMKDYANKTLVTSKKEGGDSAGK